MDHLNIFYPYESKPLYHEDQLTRGLLILMRLKQVEMIIFDLIITEMEKSDCEQIPSRLTELKGGIELLKTQVRSTARDEVSKQTGRLVSVLLTDKKLTTDHRVERTERIPVYDGLVHFDPGWIFIFENKPRHKDVWFEQLSAAFDESLEIERKPIILRWQDVIKRISLLIENNLVTEDAKIIIQDFLDFVSDKFSALNPYDKFGLCKGDEFLLTQRCISIMEDSELGKVDYHRGWKNRIELERIEAVKEIAIYPNILPNKDWQIWLDIYPGDTMNQARFFYNNLNKVKLLKLLNKEWELNPHFHISFRSSHLYWSDSSVDLERYLDFWQKKVFSNELNQVAQSDWQNYFINLKKIGIISKTDYEEIRSRFFETKMQVLNICPGIICRYKWDSSEVIPLDDKNEFVKEFKKKIIECFNTWG